MKLMVSAKPFTAELKSVLPATATRSGLPMLSGVRLEVSDGEVFIGHSHFVAGTTTPSNHSFGRAVDISVIDGQAVSIYNPAARAAMQLVISLQPPLLPDELGGPWLLYHAGVRTFTQDHHDHIHIGWDG